MLTISLIRATIRYFIKIISPFFILLLAVVPARAQQGQLAFEAGMGPNLTFNHETENWPEHDLVTVRNRVGYHYYLEAEYWPFDRFAASIGYSMSLLGLERTGFELNALYLKPTYLLASGKYLTFTASATVGLQYHNHLNEPSTSSSRLSTDGQLQASRITTTILLPERHQKILFFGGQVDLNYSLSKRSSLSFGLGGNASTRQIMTGTIEIFDINHGTDVATVENWGEFLYLTIGYRLSLSIGSES